MKKMQEQINVAIRNVALHGTGHPSFRSKFEKRCYYCNLFQKINPHIKVFAYTFPRNYVNDLGFDYIEYQRQYCVSNNNPIKIVEVWDCVV